MKKKAPKRHDRAQTETQITISLPKWLKEEITEYATADDRSRSKWIVRELTLMLDKKRAEKIKVLPRAAEEPGCYPKKKV